MNFFAHGLRFLDRPYVLAGTAVPDWLSVADRPVRVRGKLIEPHLRGDGSIQADVAAGVWQHLDDDRWFHQTRAFNELSASLSIRFREALPSDDSLRAGFLGHIVTELLIDADLIERYPTEIEAYYKRLREIEPLAVQKAVNSMATQPTANLAPLIPQFIDERFLMDYGDDSRLLWRLNQVLRRVKLPPLPADVQSVLALARPMIRDRLCDLLPEQHFGRLV